MENWQNRKFVLVFKNNDKKIFSNHCEDVLSVSFKMRVNEVRKTLVDTLNEKKAETAIEYYLGIETTTNLPLSYKIYLESGNKDDRNTNQFEVYDVYTGDDGVYYKKMKTGIKQLGLEEQEDVYVLKIEFPEENKVNLEYADILEMLKITIESKQKI